MSWVMRLLTAPFILFMEGSRFSLELFLVAQLFPAHYPGVPFL